MPWRMRSMVGSAGTAKRGPSSRPAKRTADWPVTTRARRPREAAAPATSRAVPSPNRMREAVEKSNGMALTALVGGEDVLIRDASARLGQHFGDGGCPGVIVAGLLMLHGGVEIAIDLHQHKARGVAGLLHHIEARDA